MYIYDYTFEVYMVLAYFAILNPDVDGELLVVSGWGEGSGS